MKKIIKIVLWIVAFSAIVVSIFVLAIWVNEWKPGEVENQSTGGLVPDVIGADTLKIVSWNIGYAGLGDDMDFVYDGGKSVRCSLERTMQNMKGIIEFLKQHRDADFILLQEVDFDSKRSYNINEYDSIRAALPEFMGWWGLNYVSQYVPVPLFEPIGKVRAGVVILSRYAPAEVTRLQYPGGFAFPTRMFNLKRCLLSASFKIDSAGTMLYLGNTHNSAYENGSMRKGELEYVRSYMKDRAYAMVVGDWNCNPPQYHASERELSDPNFVPVALRAEDFPPKWRFIADLSVSSSRYGYEPYNSGATTCTVIDFALATDAITPVSASTVDLGFKNSDHNPVIFKVEINR